MAADFGKYMKAIGDRVGEGFLCGGDTPTIADCALVPMLNRFTSGGVDHVPKTCLEPFPVVCAYVARFMELKTVKAWYEAQQ